MTRLEVIDRVWREINRAELPAVRKLGQALWDLGHQLDVDDRPMQDVVLTLQKNVKEALEYIIKDVS